jgi:archaellum component FlaC
LLKEKFKDFVIISNCDIKMKKALEEKYEYLLKEYENLSQNFMCDMNKYLKENIKTIKDDINYLEIIEQEFVDSHKDMLKYLK